VRLGVLLAYRRSEDPAIATFLNDSDAYLVREAAEAINDVPISPALAPLAGKLASAPVKDEAVVVRALNANYRLGDAPRAQALANYAANAAATPQMRTEALQQLARWGDVPQRDRVVGIYRPLEARAATDAATALTPLAPKLLGDGVPEGVQLATLTAVSALQLRAVVPALVTTVTSDKATEAVRAAALRTLDAFGGQEAIEAAAAAAKSNVPELRLAALEILAQRAPERALPSIKRLVASKSEIEQQAAFLALGQLQSPQAPALLVSAIDQLAAGKVQPGAQMELLETVDKSSAPAVKTRWEKQKAAWTASGDALAPYRFALAGGNPRAGAEQFFNNKVLPCARCHRAFGEGGDAGPNLGAISAQHPPEYLLESVVKPNAHIAAGFDTVTFTLANGDTESGSVVNESATQIVVKRGDGSQATLDPKQVKQRVAAPSSMPEIYAQVLSRTELRDVVAFLKALDGRPVPGQAPEQSFGATNRAMQSVAVEGATGGHP